MPTKRQKQILNFIISFQKKNSFAPSLEEIKKYLKLSSVSTIHFHIKKLQDEGYLNKEENSPRSISVYESQQMVKIPLLGSIVAGQPIEAIQEKETIAIPKEKIFKGGNFYALKVAGNSMIDENINDGDIVLVKEQQTANNGQKIVALIDNHEATLKTFYKEKKQIRLQPANKEYEPIIIKNGEKEVVIQGIVIDVIKNINRPEENLDLTKTKEQKEKQGINISSFIDKIICGEAIENLKNLPNNSIDLIVSDPPYNLSQGNQLKWSGSSSLKGFGGKWGKVMETWDNMPLIDYFNFTYAWLTEAKRILKPTGSIWVFGTYHNTGIINLIFQILGIEIINEVIWYKRNSFPNLSGRRLTASHETLIWGHTGGKKRKYYFNYKKSKEFFESSDLMKQKDKQMRTVWDIPNNKGKEEIKYGKHPTQKPLRVCKRIISLTSKEKDIVLSPFAGAGTECLAAHELKRHYLGFELDQNYVTIANKRLNMSETKNTLF